MIVAQLQRRPCWQARADLRVMQGCLASRQWVLGAEHCKALRAAVKQDPGSKRCIRWGCSCQGCTTDHDEKSWMT